MSRTRSALEIIVLCAILVVCLLLIVRLWPPGLWPRSPVPVNVGVPPPVEAEIVDISGSAVMGTDTAGVAVIVFSDFQCPFCARFAQQTFPTLVRDYVETGRVRVVFKHLPLDMIHPQAQRAAEAAECAAIEGQFWPMHDKLFENYRALSEDAFVVLSQAIGLGEQFSNCMATGAARQRVQDDRAVAARFGLTGTPGFLVGRLQSPDTMSVTDKLSGAGPIEQFIAAIEKASRS
jgi:protein-disulfide isomerase